jgi:hypothetical protein
LSAQPGNSGRIHGQRSIQPPVQVAKVGHFEIVTVWQDGHAGPGSHGPIEDQLGQFAGDRHRTD